MTIKSLTIYLISITWKCFSEPTKVANVRKTNQNQETDEKMRKQTFPLIVETETDW